MILLSGWNLHPTIKFLEEVETDGSFMRDVESIRWNLDREIESYHIYTLASGLDNYYLIDEGSDGDLFKQEIYVYKSISNLNEIEKAKGKITHHCNCPNCTHNKSISNLNEIEKAKGKITHHCNCPNCTHNKSITIPAYKHNTAFYCNLYILGRYWYGAKCIYPGASKSLIRIVLL